MTVVRNIGYHLTSEASVVKRKERIQEVKFNVDSESKKENKYEKKYKGQKKHQENNDSNSSKIDIYI